MMKELYFFTTYRRFYYFSRNFLENAYSYNWLDYDGQAAPL